MSESIIVCDDGYCTQDYDSVLCCAICPKKDTCPEPCLNKDVGLCSFQKVGTLESIPSGQGTLRILMKCCMCKEPIKEDESFMFYNEDYCEECYIEYVKTCDKCGIDVHLDDVYWVEIDQIHVCDNCYSQHYTSCDKCGAEVRISDTTWTGDDECVCSSCIDEYYERCDSCNGWFEKTELHDTLDDKLYCNSCKDDNTFTCEECGMLWSNNDLNEHNNRNVCQGCLIDLRRQEEEEDE